jgi:hypothetical protein
MLSYQGIFSNQSWRFDPLVVEYVKLKFCELHLGGTSPTIGRRVCSEASYNAALAEKGHSWAHALKHFAHEQMWDDADLVIAILKIDGDYLWRASMRLRNYRPVVIAAVKSDGLALESASPRLKNDRYVVMAAVRENGLALEYASLCLREDRGIVGIAVRENLYASNFARLRIRDQIQ